MAVAFVGAAISPVATVLLLAAVTVADLVYELVATGESDEHATPPLDLPESA